MILLAFVFFVVCCCLFVQYPKLCGQFYSLIHYTCQCYPQNVLVLPEDMLVSVMHLLEVGLNK